MELKEEYYDELVKFQQGVLGLFLTLTSEDTSSAEQFERNFQAKIYPSDQIFEKQEEELIDFKGKYRDELERFSSVPIQNEVLTINSEHTYYEDYLKRKSQDNISPYNQGFEE